MNNPKTLFRVHAVQRMFERGISLKKVRQTLVAGETVENYSAEMPEPGRLILGIQGNRPIHVVVSENPEANEKTIITVYVADSNKWKPGFRSRKS